MVCCFPGFSSDGFVAQAGAPEAESGGVEDYSISTT